MYDVAKRSLAFTVATGGLLLSGPGFAPLAEAAVVGFGNSTGPAQTSGVAESHVASPSALSAPLSVRKAEPLQPNINHPLPAPRSGPAPAGASATANVSHDGGILAGNTIQVPIDLGLDLCGTTVVAAAVKDVVGSTTCTSSSGASANVVTDHSGGIGSGNTVQVPISAPILACGTTAELVAVKDDTDPTTCTPVPAPGTGGGANATAVSKQSGGVLSGDIVQAPVNVPVDLCGNSVTAVGDKSNTAGTNCSPTAAPAGGLMPGSSATAVSLHSGGIGSGIIAQAPINVPVTGCDNHVGGVEVGDSAGAGTSCVQNTGGAYAAGLSLHSGGIVAGDTVQAPVDTPVELCGDTVVAVSSHSSAPSDAALCGEMPGQGGSHSISITNGSAGIGAGDTAAVPIAVPIQACGDEAEGVAIDGEGAGAICSAGTSSRVVTTTTNSGGIGSGIGVGAPGAVPVLACGADVNGVVTGTDLAGASCGSQPPVTPAPCPPPPVCVPPAVPVGAPMSSPVHSPATRSAEAVASPGPSTVPGNGPYCGPSTSPAPPVSPTPSGASCVCPTPPPPPPPCPPTSPPPVMPPPPPTSPPTSPPPVMPPPPPPPPTSPPTSPPPVMPPPPPPPPTSPPTSPPPVMPPPPPPPPTSPPTSPPPVMPPPPPPPPTSPPQSPPPPPPTTTVPPGVPPGTSPPPPPGGHVPPGPLARTGDGAGFGLALGGSALLAGLGLRLTGKRRTR
jgi:hypothetical protein